MIRYIEAKTNFVKEQIKKTKWKNKHYIDDLLKIERVISGEGVGWTVGPIITHFEQKYSKEYKAIFKELCPKKLKDLKEYQKKEGEKERKLKELWEKKKLEEEKQDKEDWKKMGGK